MDKIVVPESTECHRVVNLILCMDKTKRCKFYLRQSDKHNYDITRNAVNTYLNVTF